MIEAYLTSNNLLALPIAYFSGLLLSFTPCVYPLIPVTIAFIGTQGESKQKSFIISFVYVLGISFTYTVLGIIASITGRIFGELSHHPIAYVVVGVLFVIFGLSMMDIIIFPEIIIFSHKSKPKKLVQIFFAGLISGLIMGSCLSPVLAAILSYLAINKNIIFGGLTMLFFSLGLCTLLLIVGTFSGIVLPKSGKWSLGIKKVMGIILIVFGIYLISSIRKLF